jgi:hypothetical protein
VRAAAAHVEALQTVRDPKRRREHDHARHQHMVAAHPELYAADQKRAAASTQRGAKGGTFVVTASGKKRYVKKK